MNFKNFSTQVEEAMKERYKDATVDLCDVAKNNGVKYTCLKVCNKGSKLSEVIYLEPLYDAFLNGASFLEIMERIDAARLNSKETHFDLDYFMDFDKVRNRLYIKLVNYKKNKEFLLQCPHRKFADLAVLYYCKVKDKPSEGIVVIKTEHVNAWNVTEEELYNAAMNNAIRENDYTINPLLDVIKGRMGLEFMPDENTAELESICKNLKILTNKDKTYGASVIMNPGLLQKIAREFNKNMYILPSSIHESILVLDDNDMFNPRIASELFDMVEVVNATELEGEDVLSNNVYYYDKNKDEIYDYNNDTSLQVMFA